MSAPNPEWWQVIAGTLTIPATLLGLVYTFRLYQKTQLEIRELRLKIVERQRALGLPESDLPPERPGAVFKSRRSHSAHSLAMRILNGVMVFALLFAIPNLHAPQISAADRITSSLITAVAGVVIVYRLARVAERRDYRRLVVVAVTAVVATGLLWLAFLLMQAVYMPYGPITTTRRGMVVIGTRLTSAGAECLARFGGDRYYALQSVDFRPELIWTSESIRQIALVLLSMFSLALLSTVTAGAALFRLWRQLFIIREDIDALSSAKAG